MHRTTLAGGSVNLVPYLKLSPTLRNCLCLLPSNALFPWSTCQASSWPSLLRRPPMPLVNTFLAEKTTTLLLVIRILPPLLRPPVPLVNPFLAEKTLLLLLMIRIWPPLLRLPMPLVNTYLAKKTLLVIRIWLPLFRPPKSLVNPFLAEKTTTLLLLVIRIWPPLLRPPMPLVNPFLAKKTLLLLFLLVIRIWPPLLRPPMPLVNPFLAEKMTTLLVVRITQDLRATVALLGPRPSSLTDHPRRPHPTPIDPQQPMPVARPQPGLPHLLSVVVASITQV